jgi:hypothetical protein
VSNFTLGHWLVVGFLLWCGYRLLVRRRPQRPPTAAQAGETWQLDVVGESFYRDNLKSLFKREAPGDEVECSATLKLDNGNPHDDQAVAVHIRGLQVGHLSRANARRYRASKVGTSDSLVDAVVWIPDDQQDHYSVTLFLRM